MSKQNILFSLLAAALTFGAPAQAAKPDAVVQWSNGFPSGEHFNLNIHGKKDGFVCDPAAAGGASLFVPEYGSALIQFVSNRRSAVSELTVHDACSFSPDDPATVQLPAKEYQVYARILGKPGKPGAERSVVFYPKLLDACDDTLEPAFDSFLSCADSSLLGIGKVTVGGAFDRESQSLTRLAPAKGGNKALEITDLFRWSGYVCDAVYDIDADGEITLADVASDLNGDGLIDQYDLAIYLSTSCQLFEHEWIFNIADLVVYGWDYQNSGSKLVQIRFYPVDTTTFTQDAVRIQNAPIEQGARKADRKRIKRSGRKQR